ncbi:MAG: 3-hydroxybutyryl-CoA dehydrogenase, partial [Acidimicrobiaceae bacterium]|nr:3-hydroxybutyryl-CoA dehydrogenase [Acidimicrobiaceae bacterium]
MSERSDRAVAPARHVGVLGAGTMGVGIAVVMARAGHQVLVRDVDDARVASGLEQIERFFDRSVRIGKLDATDRDAILRQVGGTARLQDLATCEVVVEAIFEDVELKAATFGELDSICPPETLFHTNTSTLSVTAIAAGSKHPERVIGTHYCNPAPLMKLVEVVRGRRTSEETYRATIDFVRGLGKEIVTTEDTPGFLVNRFLVPFENDCIRALEAGLGTVESIDTAVKLALRYPLGTFELL